MVREHYSSHEQPPKRGRPDDPLTPEARAAAERVAVGKAALAELERLGGRDDDARFRPPPEAEVPLELADVPKTPQEAQSKLAAAIDNMRQSVGDSGSAFEEAYAAAQGLAGYMRPAQKDFINSLKEDRAAVKRIRGIKHKRRAASPEGRGAT